MKLDNQIEIEKMLRKAFEFNIHNLIIASDKSENTVDIYTYEIFGENKCRQFQVVITNTFYNGRFKKKELLMERYTNFRHCELRIYVRNVQPYMSYTLVKKNNLDFVLTGIEGEMIKTISKILNFSMSVYNEPEINWGTIYTNGTMTFPYSLLRDGDVDLLIGIFFSSAVAIKYFSESFSYLRTPYVFVAKHRFKYDRNDGAWILNPFEWSTWMCLAVYFVIVKFLINLTIIFKLKQEKINVDRNCKSSSWLRLFAISLNIPQIVANSKNRFCFSIIFWCFGLIIFNIAYQGKLYAAYTRLQPQKPIVLEDITKYNYLIITRGSLEHYKILISLNINPERFVTVDVQDPEEIYKILSQSKEKFVGTFTALHRFLYYMQTKRLYDNYQLVQEPLSVQQICTFFKKNSFLVRPFNRVIHFLNDFGLISKWMSDASGVLKYPNIEVKKFYVNHANTPIALTLKTFRKLFFSFFILQFVAFFIFIGELVMGCCEGLNRE
ncbi:uncharacterized protein LOC119673444 [Teleopsis dalmanni]|uniref:uncharacterized protein LOC119673444 n=1 Tax=Teleopsis dalmanni TaxID=139649 RepID=UPI0018CEB55A|nr:uncharacterized protein LOC119673444 [Teleopsis dalmanni]